MERVVVCNEWGVKKKGRPLLRVEYRVSQTTVVAGAKEPNETPWNGDVLVRPSVVTLHWAERIHRLLVLQPRQSMEVWQSEGIKLNQRGTIEDYDRSSRVYDLHQWGLFLLVFVVMSLVDGFVMFGTLCFEPVFPCYLQRWLRFLYRSQDETGKEVTPKQNLLCGGFVAVYCAMERRITVWMRRFWTACWLNSRVSTGKRRHLLWCAFGRT